MSVFTSKSRYQILGLSVSLLTLLGCSHCINQPIIPFTEFQEVAPLLINAKTIETGRGLGEAVEENGKYVTDHIITYQFSEAEETPDIDFSPFEKLLQSKGKFTSWGRRIKEGLYWVEHWSNGSMFIYLEIAYLKNGRIQVSLCQVNLDG